MLAERRDGSPERTVLTGVLVSRAVLGPVAARWEKPGLFPSPWANVIGGWAVDYYNKFKRAPGRDIGEYYDAWAETADRETAALVREFLNSLAAEHQLLRETASPDHVLDVAGVLFNRARIAAVTRKAAQYNDAGNVAKAREVMESYRRVEVGVGAGIEVLGDEEAVRKAFEASKEDMITYPGALGNFFRGKLGRDQFVAFWAKEKGGKSYFLMDAAVLGAEQERNVAYFVLGDLSQDQVIQRLGARLARKPFRAGLTVRWPTDMSVVGKRPEVERDTTDDAPALSWEEAYAAFRALGKKVGTERLKLSVHPAGSQSVGGIEAVLESWAQDDWLPDVLVLDYADVIAKPEGYRDEHRHAVNEVWLALKGLNQRLHCLLLTATQVDAKSYSAKLLRRENFSENHLKLAHVNGVVGINQTDTEKEDELCRLNWVVGRDLEFPEDRVVWVAQCLPVARPWVLSTF